jgi:hypothetical protein
VARARALPGHHRSLAGVEARGVVTLVVIPPDGDPPVPAPALLAAVERHVRCRRPLGTELHVVGPVYREVTVSATLHARRGAASGLAERAVAALRSYLDPLRGGPDGTGWPFGRDLLTAELLALLGALDDVTYVEGLGLADAGDTAPRCGNLPLCGTELVSLKPPRITVIEEEA